MYHDLLPAAEARSAERLRSRDLLDGDVSGVRILLGGQPAKIMLNFTVDRDVAPGHDRVRVENRTADHERAAVDRAAGGDFEQSLRIGLADEVEWVFAVGIGIELHLCRAGTQNELWAVLRQDGIELKPARGRVARANTRIVDRERWTAQKAARRSRKGHES